MVHCPGCSRDFVNSTALWTHASTIKSKPHALCTECKLIFSSKEELASHRTNSTPSNCTICQKKLHSSSYSAMASHFNDSHSKCPVCGKGSLTYAGLPEHQKAKHPKAKHPLFLPPAAPPTAPSFVCEVACGRSFSSKALRDEHVSTSHPACEHCDQRFLSDVVLQTHIASTHLQCSCTICLRNAELRCDVCKIQFASQGQLQVHYLDSPSHIQCNICNIGFPDADNAKEHTSNVHPGPFAYLTPPSETDDSRTSPSNPLDVPHAQQSLEEVSSGDPASLSEEGDLPSLPPAADIRSRIMSSEREHSSEPIAEQERSSETHEEPEGPTSSLNSASVSGPDSDVESNISRDSTQSSPQSFATSPEELSDVYEGSDSVDTSLLGAVEVPISSKIPGALADNINRTSAEETRGRHSKTVISPRENIQSFHCRICRKTACDDITVTICGHIFCNKCITQAIISKPSCPVCRSALLLYCVFRIDLSV